MYTSIVVGSDGSPTAEIALGKAIELAGATGARLHVVSAYSPTPSHVAGAAPGAEAYHYAADSSFKADSVLERAMTRAGAENVEIEQHAPKGNPADGLLRVADESDADLIIIGSVGMHGAKRIFGSIPNRVSHKSNCDVLIVNTDR
jgi:nucleotide-binding universal stress UspA family protein